ncbi:SIMPL domain-containing protein [Catalinimonas niigatensis]|uniref:SIMPL domain-containing protein n=1 Tax=Catalinimonas niigatensis TaxID=1397264 RepID=UPI00266699DF|nr:SIMPL domain-containing protein [Catalinimonas niigatensis]WPP52377.1 SIMPL domain-containing protein [Catalinimonas niigatensis]
MLTGVCLLATGMSFAQTNKEEFIKKIEVYGRAEREVTPDEIYFSITLKEYLNDNKQKVEIDKLERELYNAVRKIGIRDEDFQIENVFGYNQDWYPRDKKKDREDFLAQKQYRIKFIELDKINRLFEYLDPKGIQQANISEYSHSQIEQYRRDLKIEALRNAKEKADYLLTGIGENRGEVLEVQEINNGYQPPIMYKARNMAMMESADSGAMDSPSIDFQKIKIESEVRAVFRIN